MAGDKPKTGIGVSQRHILWGIAGLLCLAAIGAWSFRGDWLPPMGRAPKPATLPVPTPDPHAKREAVLVVDSYIAEKAVDHVAEMEVDLGTDVPPQHVTLYRHGNRQREEADGPRATSSLADLDAGYTWQVTLEASGRPVGLHMRQIEVSRDYFRVATDRTERWLGETCRIMVRVRSYDMKGVHGWLEAECVTQDGILLWRGGYADDGELRRIARVTRLERRAVKTSEVLLAGKPLELSTYGDWSGSGIGANYVVRLQNDDSKASNEFIETRRFGDMSLKLEPNGRAYSNNGYYIHFGVARDGRVNALNITAMSKTSGTPGQGKRVGKATILGETCTQYTYPPSDPNIEDSFGWGECITSDGIQLQQSGFIHTTFATYSAVSFKRGTMTRADVAPPPSLFSGKWRAL